VDYPAEVRGANGLRTESVRAREEKETLDAVAFLLDMGVPVNETAPNGNTALFAAVPQGFDSVVRLLVSKGADVNVKNKAGQTPLGLAKPKPPAPANR
jgi:ankyrin repeat protein